MGKKERLRKEQEELLERAINETDEEKRRKLFDELSETIEIWKIDDTNKRIKVIKEFLEEIKNSRGKIRKMKKCSIRFGEFEPILYPDQIITIKRYLEILEMAEKEEEDSIRMTNTFYLTPEGANMDYHLDIHHKKGKKRK